MRLGVTGFTPIHGNTGNLDFGDFGGFVNYENSPGYQKMYGDT